MAGNTGNRGWRDGAEFSSWTPTRNIAVQRLITLTTTDNPSPPGHAKTDLFAMTGRLGGKEHVGNQKQPSVEKRAGDE